MWMIDCFISKNPLKICQRLTIECIGSQIIITKETEYEVKKELLAFKMQSEILILIFILIIKLFLS